ncbi:MAG: alpha/beta hydrolase [Terrimicrobiaceae bacterium]
MKWLMRLGVLMVLGYVSFAMLTCSLQRSMTYFPEVDTLENLTPRATATGMKAWMDSDGKFIGWRSQGGDSGKAVMVLHGNAGNALHRNALAGRIRAADPKTSVWILEYPGFGAREGSPSEEALVGAALAGLDAIPGSEMPVVLGESLGTGVAGVLAGKASGRISGLILLTPFDSLVSVAASHYPWLPVGIMMADRYESAQALAGLEIPAVFVVAGEDTVTPTRLGLRLHGGYRGPKELLVIDGAGHNDVVEALSSEDWRKILQFVRRLSTGG